MHAPNANDRRALTEAFLQAYDKLDEWMRHKLRADERIGHAELIRDASQRFRAIRGLQDALHKFAHLRNVLVHNADRDRWDPIADPHPDAVRTYVELVEQHSRIAAVFITERGRSDEKLLASSPLGTSRVTSSTARRPSRMLTS